MMAEVVRRPDSSSSSSRSFSQSPQKKHRSDSSSSPTKKNGQHHKKSSSLSTSLPSSPSKEERKKLAKEILASGGDQLKATLKQRGMLHALLSDPVKFIKSNQKQGQDYTTLSLTPVHDPNFAAVQKRKAEQKQHSLLLHTDSPKINRNGAAASDSEEDEGTSTSKNGKAKARDLYPHKISLRFPGKVRPVATGLGNYGNTCYMNSVMQALVHTPPLAFALLTQDLATLHGEWGGPKRPDAFDAVTALQAFAKRSLTGSKSNNAPLEFIRNLKSFAKTLRKGAQEDAHEYLRFLLEALQQSCLAKAPKGLKPDDPIRQTTFVQKTFGGNLRSRVTCHNCGHNSDTFDPFMDLSLDMRKGIDSLTDAFRAFVAKDHLTGSEKYKCDKCKRKVDATKQFTIHTAPPALTVHLKRFTVFGKKVSRQIAFDETLNIAPYLSVNNGPAKYKLYAAVHHYGSGPSSGHYVASVKSPNGRWTKMDDSYASEMGSKGPVNDQSAYILFYLREKEEILEKAISKAVAPSPKELKRKQVQEEEESASESGDESEEDGDEFDDEAAYQAILLRRRKADAAQKSSLSDTDSTASAKAKLNGTSAKLDQMLSSKPNPPSSFYGSPAAPRIPSNPFSMPSTTGEEEEEELGTAVSRDDYESLVGPSTSTTITSTSTTVDPEADSAEEDEEAMMAAASTAALSKKEKRKMKKAAQIIDLAKKGRGVPSSPYANALTTSFSSGSGSKDLKKKKAKKDKNAALGGFAGKMKPRPSF